MTQSPDEDRTLLELYVTQSDERAFRRLVERHLPLVHGVACRITASEDLARDVVQNAFVRLAQQAAFIPRRVLLPAWLHRTTRSLAIDLVRSEASRRQREIRTASQFSAMDEQPVEPQWSALAPVVDGLIDELSATDREVILLRFYSDESHVKIGARLGLSEEAARKRTTRALERLRMLLGKKGVRTTSAALAALLPAHASATPPAGLLGSVLSATHGMVPSQSAHAAFLAMNATQKSVLTAAALVFLGSAGYSLRPATEIAVAPVISSGSAASSMRGPRVGETRPRVVRTLPRTKAARLERLTEILSMENSPDRIREFVAYANLLSPALYAETSEEMWPLVKKLTRPDEMHYLLGLWTRTDPSAAADFAAAQKDLYFSAGAILATWASSDPAAALAWARDHPQGNTFNYMELAVLAETGRHDPGQVVRFCEALGSESDKIAAVTFVTSSCGEQPDLIGQMLPLVKDPVVKRQLLALLALGSDPASAFAKWKGDPEAETAHFCQNLFRVWGGIDLDAASAALDELPAGPNRDQAMTGIGNAARAYGPAAALNLIRQHPGYMDDREVAHSLLALWSDHPEVVVKNIDLISDPKQREKFWSENLPHWQSADPAAANRWIESADLPESVRSQLQPR